MNSKFKAKKPKPPAAQRPSGARHPGFSALAKKIRAEIHAAVRAPGFQDYLQQLLLELCRVDTTPNSDVAKMRDAEARCFQILERELGALAFAGARRERRPIDPAIQQHPHYSLLHFTKTAGRPRGLSPAATYAGRSNLVYVAPGAGDRIGGASVALNVHIDVVAPYFPPRVKAGVVFGRGACDDKGPLVAMVAALKVLSKVLAPAGLKLNRNIVAMFVVEEETGGNGSLSLAMDRELKSLYDVVLVGEPTSLKIHPANRGAVWYRAELKPPARLSAFEMSAFVIEALEQEGAALRAESRHALFPQRPVQTCHGIIGPFGEHPSRICGAVSFQILFARNPGPAAESLVRDCLESGLAGYLGLYGDKSKVTDPTTGQPMVARHYDLRPVNRGFTVTVHGATGHMGAIRERDGAITKTAHLIRSLVFSKAKLAALAGPVKFELEGNSRGQSLVMEGGQGFLPTHGITEVMERLRQAAERGAENYLRRCGQAEVGAQAEAKTVTVTYEKLHNAAFDGDPDSPAMRQALAATKICGLEKSEPVAGWTVSCDARLFATEYPGLPVLTFGPGELARAHSDQEQIALPDIARAVEFLVIFLLRQTGTLT
jgi:acetylornithine deacetylase/succinyl-diaminopimelate desuccinylase-like protein